MIDFLSCILGIQRVFSVYISFGVFWFGYNSRIFVAYTLFTVVRYFFVFEETVNLYRKVVIPVWDTNQYPNRHLPKMVLINQRLILQSLSYKFCLFANATHKINHARWNLTFTCKITPRVNFHYLLWVKFLSTQILIFSAQTPDLHIVKRKLAVTF